MEPESKINNIEEISAQGEEASSCDLCGCQAQVIDPCGCVEIDPCGCFVDPCSCC